MIINFLDTKSKFDINSNIKLKSSPPPKNAQSIETVENNELDSQETYSRSEIEQLQSNVLNSLNYASSQNLLPSTLPDQLNIKFLNISRIDKLKDRFLSSTIAQLEDPNTLYVSTHLLPQNQPNSKNSLISQLHDKFQNPQQVLDLVVFHELGHLVFNNSFSNLTQFNQELLNTKSLLEKFRDKFLRENHESIPLYQINRSLEEHFADSYSSIVLSKRYGTKPEDYIGFRNSNDPDGSTRTQGFDININRLDKDEFSKISNINYERDGIDTVIKQLYELSLAASKEVMGNKLRIVRNDDLLSKLQSNLKAFNISTENNKKDILDKAEDLIKSKADNSEPKIFPNKRMFNISNIEEQLVFFDNKFNQAEPSSKSNRLKK